MSTKAARVRANKVYRKRHAERLSRERKQKRNVSNPHFKKTEDAYRKKNRDRIAKHALQDRVRKFGITISRLEEMKEEQDNKCAICGNPPHRRDLHIDHDHKTGKVRALLCHFCNAGLGYFRDDVDRMYLAIEYLMKHNENSNWRDMKAVKI